ncbi:MAG: hypothetical protein AABY22_30855 [Nanoarchaeota archaeon]
MIIKKEFENKPIWKKHTCSEGYWVVIKIIRKIGGGYIYDFKCNHCGCGWQYNDIAPITPENLNDLKELKQRLKLR